MHAHLHAKPLTCGDPTHAVTLPLTFTDEDGAPHRRELCLTYPQADQLARTLAPTAPGR